MSMAKRLVKKGVTVVRDGNRVRPQVGKMFDFSKEEIDALKDSGALGAAKEGEDDDGEATTASTSRSRASSAEASQAGAKDGKKTATANTENKDAGKAAKESGGTAGSDDDL